MGSKHNKLLEKLRCNPRNFTWDELVTLLSFFGYQESTKTGGSSRKFLNPIFPQGIRLHKRHPDPTLLPYQVRDVIEALKNAGFVEEDSNDE